MSIRPATRARRLRDKAQQHTDCLGRLRAVAGYSIHLTRSRHSIPQASGIFDFPARGMGNLLLVQTFEPVAVTLFELVTAYLETGRHFLILY